MKAHHFYKRGETPMRKHRIIQPRLTYHAVSRIIELRNLMEDDTIKALLEYCIDMALNKYAFQLINYQIMDNHVHLLIRTIDDGATISQIMQYIKSIFARKLNKLLKRIGPVWNERFNDTIVDFAEDPQKYLCNLIWYFANNPVRAKKIKSPFESYFGASRAYFDKHFKPTLKITLHYYFLQLGETLDDCIAMLISYGRSDMCL